jgi:hypothetical protein
MFGFIKKLFGFDQTTMKNAGVQIEQVQQKVEEAPVEAAPYKVPEPAPVAEIPLVVEAPAPAKKKRYYAKKSSTKKATPAKEVAIAKKPGRKPKAK